MRQRQKIQTLLRQQGRKNVDVDAFRRRSRRRLPDGWPDIDLDADRRLRARRTIRARLVTRARPLSLAGY